MRFRRVEGFTLIELLVVISIIAVMVSLLLPAVQSARESARRTRCSNHVKQMTLALHNYETSHRRFPAGRLTPDWRDASGVRTSYTNYNQVNQNPGSGHWTGFRSVHIAILPYMEQGNLYDLIDFSRATAVRMTTDGRPTNANYPAYSQAAGLFLCPSDPNTGRIVSENNYRWNFGGSSPHAGAQDSNHNHVHSASHGGYRASGNGAFTIGEGLSVAAYRVGLSNVVFLSERTKGSGLNLATTRPPLEDIVTVPGRANRLWLPDEILQRCATFAGGPGLFHFNSAGRWLHGSNFSNGWPFAFYASTFYNHVASPNWQHHDCGGWSAIPDAPGEHAIVSARSKHPGGVNVGLGDGAVKFLTDSIDLSLWRELGARNHNTAVAFDGP